MPVTGARCSHPLSQCRNTGAGSLKTTARGLLSELRVQIRLTEMGISLFLPLGHDHPFDLVAYMGGRWSRVQVKTMRYGAWAGKPNGTLYMSFSSVVDRAGGKVPKMLTTADCDVVVGFHPDTARFYAVPPTGRRGIYPRITAALNNTKLVNDAAAFELTSLDQIFRMG